MGIPGGSAKGGNRDAGSKRRLGISIRFPSSTIIRETLNLSVRATRPLLMNHFKKKRVPEL